MNKRLRSRVLAASIFSSAVFGVAVPWMESPVRAQDKATPQEMLQRGQNLYDQKNYAEAKRILNDIDPAQLSEDLRAKRAALLTQTDQALAQAMGPNGRFDSAQQDMDAGKLASAATKFQTLADDASTPTDVRQKAATQLALVKRQQEARADDMKKLLGQAEDLYNAGKIDDAQNALNTVEMVGADLGWEATPRIKQLQDKINEKKVAAVRTSGDAALAQGNASPTPAGTMSGPNPMDVTPGGATAGGDTGNLIQSQAGLDAVMRDRAQTLYDEAMHNSQDLQQRQQYQNSMAEAQQAIDLIDQNRKYFSDVDSTRLRGDAQRQLDAVQADYQHFQEMQAANQRIEATQAAHLRDQRNADIRRQKVAQLVADAQKLYDGTQFKEAADLLKQATIIDPQDKSAALLLRVVSDKIIARDAAAIESRKGMEALRQNLDTSEHLIPYADLMVYPDNWPDIARRRGTEDASQESSQNRKVRSDLEDNWKEGLDITGMGLEKVIDFIRNNLGDNILVNWPALRTAGIDNNTEVSLKLQNVSFRKALTEVLAQVSGTVTDPLSQLTYTIDDGIITISTRSDLQSAKYQQVRAYDIRDMLVAPDNSVQAPVLNLNSLTSSGTTSVGGQGGGFGGQQGGGFGGQQGGGGGQGIFQTTQTATSNANLLQQRADAVKALEETIKNTVSPDTWRDNQGSIGTIQELNGMLIINQTIDNQYQVFNLLQQLRESRSIEIAVESRLLLVSNNFLDDFRIGWNLSFPAGSLGNNVGGFTVGNNNTFTNAAPGTTGVPGSLSSFGTTPSLSLSTSIIDNWTLNLILAATQADHRAITVTAPRVTLFNGQPGFISVTNQQNIVTSFNQTTSAGGVNGGGAVGTSLQIATLSTGVVLSVTATVSPDRRYVIMVIHPTLSTLDGVDTISTSNSTGPNATNGTNSFAAVGGAFVQLPKVATTEINTMVSIPDGGTLLIGGQKLVGETEIEVGVPVLSKIPGVNRLFTNRSYVKDERTLLVLVRPNIILHNEIENELFGPGYDRPSGLPGNVGVGPTSVNIGVGGGI